MVKVSTPYFLSWKCWAANGAYAIAYWSTAIDLIRFSLLSPPSETSNVLILVLVKNPADFIGRVLGESAKNTKAILKATEGKVLVIDEAYMLYSGGGRAGIYTTSNPYKTAVVDTIVAEVQSALGEARCVPLLGYQEKLEGMFRNTNACLSRRFALDGAFDFGGFDDDQLREILELKLKKQYLKATKEAKDIAISMLARARHRPNFGNAGGVENIISHAKASH